MLWSSQVHECDITFAIEYLLRESGWRMLDKRTPHSRNKDNQVMSVEYFTYYTQFDRTVYATETRHLWRLTRNDPCEGPEIVHIIRAKMMFTPYESIPNTRHQFVIVQMDYFTSYVRCISFLSYINGPIDVLCKVHLISSYINGPVQVLRCVHLISLEYKWTNSCLM